MIKGTKLVEGKPFLRYTWTNNILTVILLPQDVQTVIEGFDNFKEAWNHYKTITQS